MLDRVSPQNRLLDALSFTSPGKIKTYAELTAAVEQTRAAYLEAVDTSIGKEAAGAAYDAAQGDLGCYCDDICGTDEWRGCRPKREVVLDWTGGRFRCP